MIRTIRNKIVHHPETARAIGEASATRRQAYNLAVEYSLAHPNAPYNQVQSLLTRRRQEDPVHWGHTRLALQRPGLKQGYDATKAFHKADAGVLKECTQEIKYRNDKTRKAKLPKDGNNKKRDPDSGRLFLKRGRNPEYLRIDNAQAIRLIPDPGGKTARTIQTNGMTLHLTKPVPASTSVRAITLIERAPARLNRRDKQAGKTPRKNTEIEEKRYEIRIHHHIPDPPTVYTLGTLGLDPGVKRLITDSENETYEMSPAAQERLERAAQARSSRYEKIARLQKMHPGKKPESRQVQKLRKEIKATNRRTDGLRDNEERRIAGAIAQKVQRQRGRPSRNVAIEKTPTKNMTRSAKGTNENPGRNVAQKSGLNTEILGCRWSKLKVRVANACEKQGTMYFEVPAPFSSQRCSRCQYVHKENRKSQAEFRCIKCGNQKNADHNAALNHAKAADVLLYQRLTAWIRRKERRKGTQQGKKTRGRG